MKVRRLALIFLAPASLSLTTASFADDSAKLPVAILLPLSGPVAEMGQSFKRGIDLYIEDHPQAKLERIYEDHRYDGKTVVTALHAVSAKAHDGLVIVWGNAPASAAAPVAEQQHIPTLAVSMNSDAKGRGYVVSLGPPLREVVGEILKALQYVGAKRVGAVAVDIGNSLEAIGLISEALGGDVTTKIVSNDEVDFKSVIMQLRSRSVDGLVVFLLPQQALTFLRQAKQLNYSPAIVGGDVFGVDSFRKEAESLSSKVGFVYGAVRPDFINRLAQSPAGASCFFEVATGYSIAAMIDGAVDRSRVLPAGGDILHQLASVDTAGLPLTKIEYSKTNDFGRHFEVGSQYYAISRK